MEVPMPPITQKDKRAFSLNQFELHRTLGRTSYRLYLSPIYTCFYIGTGTFGRVRLVKDTIDNNIYALKILKKSEVVRLGQVRHTIDVILNHLDAFDYF